MATAVIDTNKMNKLGLRRKPTYQEIIGMLDDNDKITGKLPNRDATFFKSSPEGSFFDGSDSMEQLREEQGRLLLRQMSEVLLRQNVRTAGRTFHTERARQLPLTSPVISQQSQPMDVEQEEPNQPTQAPPSTRLQQATQMDVELEQRRNQAMKRKEETAMNHRGEVFKQNKPTITELIYPIGQPRSFEPIKPETFNIATTEDEAMQQPMSKPKPKPPKAKAKAVATSSSSSSPTLTDIPVIEVMNTSSSSKRAEPETRIEPRGKAGRPKKYKEGTDRADGTKRDGSEPEDTIPKKKRNKKKTEMALGGVEAGVEADDEIEEPIVRKGVRKTIQKPVAPSSIGIQKLREEFLNAKNKDMISSQDFDTYADLYKSWLSFKGNQSKKTQVLKELRKHYKDVLFDKIRKTFREQ